MRESVAQKTEVTVQPSSGFEKGKEDEAGDVEQGELIALQPRHASAQGIGELRDDWLESAKKLPSDRLSSENIEPARMREESRFTYYRAERAQSLGIAVIELVPSAEE
ncbi:MAG TPA: hypothetical protein VNT29_01945 [Candidatus Limnocylindrales bacterium]|nr:hypothetical protein [Candidatus Limnocylindrales bacterium]